MKKILVLAVVGILVLLVSCTVAGEILIDETVHISPLTVRCYPLYLDRGEKITVEIEQTEDYLIGDKPTVDVYIRSLAQPDRVVYCAYDVIRDRFTLTGPEWTSAHAYEYELVLDNSRGHRSLIVDIKVEKETPPTPQPKLPERSDRSTPKEPGFGVISAIAGVLIVLYLIRRNR